MRWKAVKMVNCQSWSDKSPYMSFSLDKVNVIQARNETGKSVLWKMTKAAAFPRAVLGYGLDDLVRWGQDTAYIRWVLEGPDDNDIEVGFYILKDDSFVYRLTIDGKRQEWRFGWNDTTVAMPEEVADILGLILDYKSQTVINIIEKTEQPFINTRDSETDARILASILYDPKVEGIQDNLEVQLNRLERGLRVAKATVDSRERELVGMPVYNLCSIRDKINKLNYYEIVSTHADTYLEAAETILKLPLPPRFNPNLMPLVESITECYKDNIECGQAFDVCVNHMSSAPPVMININPVVSVASDFLDAINNTAITVQALESLEKPSSDIKELPFLQEVLTYCELLDNILSAISALENIVSEMDALLKPLSPGNSLAMKLLLNFSILDNYVTKEYLKIPEPGALVESPIVEELYQLWRTSNFGMSQNILELWNLNNKIERNNEVLHELDVLADEISDVVQICPTCGQTMNLKEALN